MRVACVWLPQLPLRVEVLRHPAWDGRPLVLGAAPGERKVVHLCSPEAEQAGVRPGLPLREVLALCPEAIVLQPDPVRTAAVLDEVVARLQRVSPAIEPAGGEDVFLDLRGLAALYGELAALEQAIRAAVPPLLRPRLGIGGGKFAAAVAAREARPDGSTPGRSTPGRSTPGGPADGCAARLAGTRVVPAGATAAFLAPLPVRYLPLPLAVLPRLELLGLRTIGDLAALPLAAVQAQLGPAGARAWRLAHGQDDAPVVPRPVRRAVQAARRFDDPLASVGAIMAALDQLLADVFREGVGHPEPPDVDHSPSHDVGRRPSARGQLSTGGRAAGGARGAPSDSAPPAGPVRGRLEGRSARQVRLRALLADGTSWERLFTFKEALSSREAARQTLKGKLELPGALPPAPVEELALELLGLGGEAARQPSLFTARARQLGPIAEAARQLRARYGGHLPLYHAMEVEPWSRLPERRWALVTCDL